MTDDFLPRQPKNQEVKDGRGKSNIPPIVSSPSEDYFRKETPDSYDDVPSSPQEEERD